MNILFVIIGESFRKGGQGSRIVGSDSSYTEQIKASNSHINLINHLIIKNNVVNIDISLSTYQTKFTENLVEIYQDHLIKTNMLEKPIGLTNIFRNSLKDILFRETNGLRSLWCNSIKKGFNKYECIFYLRVDLFLKPKFFDLFDPFSKTIQFPCVCWKKDSVEKGHPRVSDVMMLFPQKYFYLLNKINIGHGTWAEFVDRFRLSYDDLGTMLKTYHDSDSAKDYNPIYFIVNRSQCTTWHSKDYIFNKNQYNSNSRTTSIWKK